MELVLGTVQFGLAYGVAGRGTPVPAGDVRTLLVRARELGFRWLDTAAAYGDIEERLVDLVGEGDVFSTVTKVPAQPAGLGSAEAADWVTQMLARAHRRLGESLRAVLFHRAEDLLDANGSALWQAVARFAEQHALQVGVSCYEPLTLIRIAQRFPLALAQLPGNALDQRLAQLAEPLPSDLAVHVRSAFLQGLLLMPEQEAKARVPAAAPALERWHAWCRGRELPPLLAALGIVKGLPGATHCVVGVDRLEQLEAIATAWTAAPPLQAPELAELDLAVIDPRQWPGPKT